MLFFFQIFIILLATKLAGELSFRLGQPPVLGKLLVGILIGPAVLGWIEPSNLIAEMSQIGVLLLMFLAGLETDIHDLNRNRNSSLAVAVGGIIFPLGLGYLGGIMFGMDHVPAIFLGLLLSATSVSITVQTLRDLGKLNSKESVTILGAAIVDDVLVIILLAFLMSMVGSDVSLGMVVFQKFLFFAIIIGLSWKVVPVIMKRLAPLRISEAVISAGLIICFGFAYLAESLGIAGIIGAFAAGIAISQTTYKQTVEDKVIPIAYAIFVPIFFVSIGLNVTFAGIGNQIGFLIVLSLIAIFSKLVGAGLGARLTGFNNYSSLGIGTGMISRGEVALIIAALGLEAKLLPPEFYTSTIIVLILTTVVTPPMLKWVFGKETSPLTTK